MVHCRPCPPLRQGWQVVGIRVFLFLVFASAGPGFVAGGEDALEQLFAGFEIFSVLTGGLLEFGLGRDQLAFAGGLEDGGAVTFEIRLDLLQVRHPGIQIAKQLLNLGDNLLLLRKRGKRKR